MRAALIAIGGVLLSLSLLNFDLTSGNPVAGEDRSGTVHVTDDDSLDRNGNVRADVPAGLTVSRDAASTFLSRPARRSRMKNLGMMLGGAYLGRKLFKGGHKSHGGYSNERSPYGPGSYPPYYGGGYGGAYGGAYAGGNGGGYRGMTREEYEEME